MRVIVRSGRRLLGRGALTGLLAASAVIGTTAGTASAGTGQVFVVAHRGDTDDDPESTLPAFEDAIDAGAGGIEFDVRYTRNGTAVAMHDATVGSTTNCTGSVASLTFTKLEKCDAGSWFGPAFAGTKVPTVNHSLLYIAKRSSTVKVFLHIKTKLTQSQANNLMKTVKADGMAGQVIFVVENDPNGHKLHNAGVPHDDLARMVHSAADWQRDYAILVPYGDADDTGLVTRALVAAAVSAGKLVLPVQGEPASLTQIITDGANGVYVNDLHAAMATLTADGLH